MRLRNMAILAAALAVTAVVVGALALDASGAKSAGKDDPPLWQFGVKFACGEQTEDQPQPDEGPVVNGRYRTAINFHNASFVDTITTSELTKKALVLYPPLPAQGQASPRPEEPQRPGGFFRVPANISPDWGFEIDCDDIRETLLGDNPQTAGSDPDPRRTAAFIKGYVVIIARAASAPDVIAAYTGHALAESGSTNPTTSDPGTTCETGDECDLVQGFSEEIEVIQARRIG